MTIVTFKQLDDPKLVPLGNGRPTKEELLVHYPVKFTWTQLKTFINAGDLGLLKRDQRLQKRYLEENEFLKIQYGTLANYLINYRLQWGKPDTHSLLSPDYELAVRLPDLSTDNNQAVKGLPPLPADAPKCFVADMVPEYISVMYNDWPYSVPPDIEHSLVWSRVPFFPEVIPQVVRQRIEFYGLWGFTGCSEPPPPPSTLPSCLGALSEWGIILDMLKIPPKCTAEEEVFLEEIGKEIGKFIKRKWPQEDWETTWFVNPPRLQSIPELSHFHVFARRKCDGSYNK